jgi:transposase InsO family protein
VTTNSKHRFPAAPNRLQRNFTATHPNQVWVSDLERHEALLHRAVMKGHRSQPVAAGW